MLQLPGAEVLLQSLAIGLAQGGVYALLASGITMLYATTRHVNIAHGSFLTLVMYVALALYMAFGLDPYVSLVVTLPLMFILGLLIFRYFLGRLLAAPVLLVFQLFVGMLLIIDNGLQLIFSTSYNKVPGFIGLSTVHFGSVVLRLPMVIAFVCSFVLAIAMYWILRNTDYGRATRAIIQNPEVAALMGINVRKVQTGVFAVGFMFLAVGGILAMPFTVLSPSGGLAFTMFAFIILIIGGMGNFMGALVGGLIVGVALSMSTLFVGSSLASAFAYFLFIVILLIKPEGLFGTV